MKIAVTARVLGGRLEGVGHYTKELLSRLILSNPNDEWHIIYDRTDDRCLISGDNVFNHFVGPKTRHPWLVLFWLEYRLPSLLKRIGADVVWYPDGLVSTTSTVRTIQTVHDLAYLSCPKGNRNRDLKYYQKHMPRYINRADRIVTISNYTEKIIVENFPFVNEKISVIYNGYSSNYKKRESEHQIIFRKKVSHGKPYFLHLGAIHPRKNVESLIRAFEMFKQSGSDYKLILAGRMAWKYKEAQRVMSESNYKEDIIHIDDIDDIIYELVGSAVALCSLSLVEGFGLPVLEAMASGVPVIVSTDSAMSEVAGEAAITCPPIDIAAIASAMNEVVTMPKLMELKVETGLLLATQFDWDEASRELYNVMSEVVGC